MIVIYCLRVHWTEFNHSTVRSWKRRTWALYFSKVPLTEGHTFQVVPEKGKDASEGHFIIALHMQRIALEIFLFPYQLKRALTFISSP